MLDPGKIEFEDRTVFRKYAAELNFGSSYNYDQPCDLSFDEFKQMVKADIYHELYGDLDEKIRRLWVFCQPATSVGLPFPNEVVRRLNEIVALLDEAKAKK